MSQQFLLLVAYLAAAVIGYLGYRGRALSADGAVAACIVGGTIFGFGGVAPSLLLVLFFVSSSLLSFFGASDASKKFAAEQFDKGGRRDAMQVLANGGVAALTMLLLPFSPQPALWGAFVGSLAAATADTWATEIGTLSKQPPRLITTFAVAPAGTSGAVTWLGMAAAALGALLISLAGSVLFLGTVVERAWWEVAISGLVAGVAGSLFDSLLGATVQASYFCPLCKKQTESPVHRCGTPTVLTHGYRWVNNDIVNLGATVMGALVGGLLVGLAG